MAMAQPAPATAVSAAASGNKPVWPESPAAVWARVHQKGFIPNVVMRRKNTNNKYEVQAEKGVEWLAMNADVYVLSTPDGEISLRDCTMYPCGCGGPHGHKRCAGPASLEGIPARPERPPRART